jgi:subtilisin family serine protease
MSLGSHLPCQAERDVIDGAPDVLFVVAALNEGNDVDANPIYPCAYPSANVVCVAATDSGDGLAGFSNYGARSVDLGAPGVSVISTYMKWDGRVSLFSDDLESPLADRWVTGGNPDTWTRTPLVGSRSGAYALSNSQLRDYAANTDNWARLTKGLDLTGRRDCAASVWLKSSLPGYDPGQPIEAQDRLVAETSPDGSAWDHRPVPLIAATSGFERWLIDLSELEGRADGGLRFRLITNGSGPGTGVALDDVEIFCVPPVEQYTGAADEFAFDFGTSMAAPHVAGTAVLMLSLDPGLSAADLKARLLASADRVPGLAGKTVSGGRLDAARALDPPAAPPASGPPAGSDPPPGGPGSDPPPSDPGSGDPPPSLPNPAYGLRIDLDSLSRTLKRGGLRKLLRSGGVRAQRLHLFAPGRLGLRVKARGGAVIATGSCAVDTPSLCSLKAPLTRRGRALLKGSRRLRLTVVLTFTPRGGLALVRRKSVSVPR